MIADPKKSNGFAFSYLRFSDPSQAMGNSEDRQEENAEQICKDVGLELLPDHQYADRGRSGFKGNQQANLDDLLKKIKSGTFAPGTTMIVEHMDRISRKGIRQTRKLVDKIFDAELNILICTPMQKFYYAVDQDNNFGDTIEIASFAFAAWTYSKNLSDRLLSKNEDRRRRARNGESVLLCSVIPSWLNHVGGGKFEVKPGAAKTIKHIFKRVIDGAGCNVVQQELNANPDKYPTLGRSATWSQKAISNIVQGRQVLGEITTKTGDVFPDYYPRMIDDKTREKANIAMASRRFDRGPQVEHVNLFKGLLFSANDDCPMHQYTTQSPRKDGSTVVVKRYKSGNARKHKKGACTASIKVEKLEDMVLDLLPKIELRKPKKQSPRKMLLDQEAYWQGEIEFMQQQIAAGDMSARVLNKPLVAAQAEYDAIQQELMKLPQSSRQPSKQYRKKLADMARGTNEERELVREGIREIIQRIDVLLVKLGKHKCSRGVCMVEITFRNGDFIRAIQLDDNLAVVRGKITTPLAEQCKDGFRFTADDYEKMKKLTM